MGDSSIDWGIPKSPLPDAHHGAGILTYETGPYFWGFYVGKSSMHGASGIGYNP